MHTTVIQQIKDIPAEEWNRIAGTGNPFLRFEFLAALEQHQCVGEHHGWLPRHIAAYDDDNKLAGLVPLYLKDNSYGEFVFDWAWADAWHRAGKPYYPKLVAAIPFTPATGPRLLVHPLAERTRVVKSLVEAALALTEQTESSSLHWLFTDKRDTDTLVEQGFMRRTGCHFHWSNQHYRNFDDFLSRLTSRKRKKIRRERRHVEEAGIQMVIVHGREATEEQWHSMHYFYRTTFEKKSGMPTLSAGFFHEISRTMGDQVVLVFAMHQDKAVAGAIMLRGDDALYGRHWGCLQEFHSLHFETCYYQGIEYCIEHGLNLFEPGAQGEHKISRGFLPTLTWSAHWIRDDGFRPVIDRYLLQEHELVIDYYNELSETSPFKKAGVENST
jgi:predicted N-acyltransferase